MQHEFAFGLLIDCMLHVQMESHVYRMCLVIAPLTLFAGLGLIILQS